MQENKPYILFTTQIHYSTADIEGSVFMGPAFTTDVGSRKIPWVEVPQELLVSPPPVKQPEEPQKQPELPIIK